MEISKNITTNDIRQVFEGEIPVYHPEFYLKSRINDGMAFIARDKDDVCGFLIYNIWWGNCPFIELIKVRQPYQRQGVGTQLLNHAKQDLRLKGFKKLVSSTEMINPLGLEFHDKTMFNKLNTLDLPHGREQFYTLDL